MSEPIEYNYMIKLREFIKTGEEIQKIGFSTIPDKHNPLITERLKQYPVGSLPIMCALVNNSKNLENLIIKVFKKKFIHRSDIGREYFEGNIDLMVIEFSLLVKNWGNSIITMTPIKNEPNIEIDHLLENNICEKYETQFQCDTCKTYFDTKSHYNRHINRKTPCDLTEKNKQLKEKSKCTYCFDFFSTPQSTKRHMDTCIKKPTNEEKLTQIIVNLNDKINELSKKIDTLNENTILNDKSEKKPKKKKN
jgi:hypothetical protein